MEDKNEVVLTSVEQFKEYLKEHPRTPEPTEPEEAI